MSSASSSLRPMNTSEILDRMFHLYRNHFLLFAGITLIPFVLTLAFRLATLATMGPEAVMPTTPAQFGPFIVVTLIAIVVYLIAYALASGATLHAVSAVHLGKNATITEAYKALRPKFWRLLRIVGLVYTFVFGPLLLCYALMGIAGFAILRTGTAGDKTGMILGLAALVLVGLSGALAACVWMIIAMPRYSLAVPACVLEDIPAWPAMRRSGFLTRKSIGRIWLVFLLTGVISFVLSYVLELPAFLVNHAAWLTPGVHMGTASWAWLYCAQFLSTTLSAPISTIAIALLYYDERIRKEAFDLHLMMQAIPQNTTSQTAGIA